MFHPGRILGYYGTPKLLVEARKALARHLVRSNPMNLPRDTNASSSDLLKMLE